MISQPETMSKGDRSVSLLMREARWNTLLKVLQRKRVTALLDLPPSEGKEA